MIDKMIAKSGEVTMTIEVEYPEGYFTKHDISPLGFLYRMATKLAVTISDVIEKKVERKEE